MSSRALSNVQEAAKEYLDPNLAAYDKASSALERVCQFSKMLLNRKSQFVAFILHRVRLSAHDTQMIYSR